MKKRVLGNSLETSAVGLGCMGFSHAYGAPMEHNEAMEKNKELLELLNYMAGQVDATPAQISMAWMLCKQPWIVPIPGTRKLERLKENAGAANVKLTLDEVRRIDQVLDEMEISEVFGVIKNNNR